MKDIKVIDNFLDEKDFGRIKSMLNGSLFPWYYSPTVVAQNNDNQFQFCHMFYQNCKETSDFINVLNPVLYKLNPTALIRIKANLLLKTIDPVIHDYHADFDWKHKWWSAIFFINTNNGKTLFKNIDKEIISKENRIVIFDGRLEHTGTTCTDQRNRILINFNYFNKELDNDI